MLVNSGSFITFYLGWEGIGLESFILISFYVERVRSTKATIKVFLINKIGDIFLLLMMLYI
ncbi:proton-conducting transporter membrane subunit [Mammaliicoccus sciuri]